MAHDWALDYIAAGLEPPKSLEETEADAAYAAPAPPPVAVEPAEVAYQTFVEINTWELTPRERDIYEAGFYSGFLSRQHEVDAAQNAFKQADHDADRYYRAAFDHDYHDCSIHENRGKYRGAATRFLDDAWGDNWDAENPIGR